MNMRKAFLLLLMFAGIFVFRTNAQNANIVGIMNVHKSPPIRVPNTTGGGVGDNSPGRLHAVEPKRMANSGTVTTDKPDDGGGGSGDNTPGKLKAVNPARIANPTGVIADKPASGISVYPNPATNQITINNSQFTIHKIEICNILGQVVYQAQIADDQSAIIVDISAFQNGIYIVKTEGDNGVVLNRVVKQ